MDIWNQLGIEATSDTRTIKRAYASKLKITRPDEHPEAFQDLHYAYKSALHYAAQTQEFVGTETEPAQINTQDCESPRLPISAEQIINGSEVTQDSKEIKSDTDISDHINSETQAQETEHNPYQAEGARLVALTQLLLNSQNELHIPDSWEFLLHSPYILDDQFNWRLGLEVLRLIQEHNQKNSNKPLLQIGSGVMTYLDSLFNWKLNRYHIYRFFDEQQFSPLLDKIVEQEPLQHTQHALDGLRGAKSIKVIEAQIQPNTLYYASPIKRFIALLIDMVGMFVIASLILKDLSDPSNYLQQPVTAEVGLIMTMILSFVYFWVCECSSVQATLGKLIMGLIVTNKNFEQLSTLQSFWRSLVFHLFSSLTYIALIINAMMGDKLLHDRITKTYVIDMRRSRQQ